VPSRRTYDCRVRILLISTYELGHQPLHVASPAAALTAASHDVRALDLAVEPLDLGLVDWAERIAISVPMHTAMRLGVEVANQIKERRADVPLAMYGLYAAMGPVGSTVDAAFVGEYEPRLVAWASDPTSGVVVDLGVGRFSVPRRDMLPGLENYAHLAVGDERRPVGYVEASHGCRHRCRHCPIPAVYDGAFRVVGTDVILADVGQLVAMGARHITVGDPDFLNGPAHALRVIEAVHDAYPELTFDVTVKVEHILAHADLLPRLAAANVVFIVSAFETVDDHTLTLLEKDHTAADMAAALDLARRAGIDIHPSWMPFTPGTRLVDLFRIFEFLAAHDLFGVTDPVQMSIRLLVPDGSLVLAIPEWRRALGPYDARALTYTWSALDPAVDRLYAQLAELASSGADRGADPTAILLDMWRLVLEANGDDPARARIDPDSGFGHPRLTEPWFCCAEPTEGQVGALVAAKPC